MRPIQVAVGATGASPWIAVDYQSAPFGIGGRVALGGTTGSSGATATFSVQHAFCQMSQPQSDVTLSRTTTTATLTFRTITEGGVTTAGQSHGLSTGDAVRVEGVGAPFDGCYDVATVPSPTQVTYTVANSGLSSNALGSTNVWRMYVGNNPNVSGATGSTDFNYGFAPNYIRLNVTAWTAGTAVMVVNQGTQS